jgi:hypothetical protein
MYMCTFNIRFRPPCIPFGASHLCFLLVVLRDYITKDARLQICWFQLLLTQSSGDFILVKTHSCSSPTVINSAI